MQTIVYHSKARKTMCGMGTFCLIGMISFQLTMQNGEMVNGKLKGYIEVGDEDDIIEILQTLFNGYGFSYITISNPSKNVPSGFSYSSGFVVHRWDTLSVILLSYSISKIAINSCIKKNNAYTWTGWKIFTGNS